jgi:hypothetical protein
MVFATGFVWPTGGEEDYLTTAMDALDGRVLWVRRYAGPGGGRDVAESVVASPDGSSVFVTGYSLGQSTSYDFATIAYDARTGTRIWLRRYDGPQHDADEALCMAITLDGRFLYVAGFAEETSEFSTDYTTIAYAPATGAIVGKRVYDGTGQYTDSAEDIYAGTEKVFVTGSSWGIDSGDDFLTAAYAI